jgi:hypothetical protein
MQGLGSAAQTLDGNSILRDMAMMNQETRMWKLSDSAAADVTRGGTPSSKKEDKNKHGFERV